MKLHIPEGHHQCHICQGHRTIRGVPCDVCDGQGFLPDPKESPESTSEFFRKLKQELASDSEQGGNC